jgi:uncharacterized damage-inducible protein DinB
MDKNIFELLVKYNKEVNQQMNNIIKTLSEEEWDKQFAGYFKSIHELCSHIFIADYNWLKRFESLNNFKSLTGIYFNKEYNYNELLFKNANEYFTKRSELDTLLVNFINEITANDLIKEFKWKDSKGIQLEKKIEVILTHLFTHQTHHRGMISLYLELLGKENDYSRLYSYSYA